MAEEAYENIYPLQIRPFSVNDLCKYNHPHYIRFGHGALLAAVGENSVNCDGHALFLPGLKEDLLKTLADPIATEEAIHGIMPLERKYLKRNKHKDALINLSERYLSKIPWVDGDIFRKAIQDKTAHLFVEWLKQKNKVCVVGMDHLRPESMEKNLGLKVDHWIRSGTNCYLRKTDILYEILELSMRFDCVLFACAVLANILVWELSKNKAFSKCALIDIGAFFDPICGVKSRVYASKISDKDLREAFMS